LSRETPRRADDLLLQLGAESVGETIPPALSYNVEDLTFYLPSRRTRVAGSLNTTPAAGGRRSIVEISGIPRGGTWVESLVNASTKPIVLLTQDASIGSQITNDLTEGWEFAATPFFDEVFLSGLYPITNDVLPWSSQLASGSILSVGTTSNVPTQNNRFLLQAGQAFPTPFWIPPKWRLLAIASVVLDQINPLNYVLTLPPLGVTP